MSRYAIGSVMIDTDITRPCVLELNPNTAAYDTPGTVVLIGRANPFTKGSDSYEAWHTQTLYLLEIARRGLEEYAEAELI